MSKLKPQQFFDLSDVSFKELFLGCQCVWEALPKINTFLSDASLGDIQVDVPEGAYLIDPETIFIGKGTVIEPGAYLKGPCWIGEGCHIRHGAYIRGNVIAGKGCVIGHTTEIKNSILLNNAHAAHFAYLGDSILGSGVNLGAGTRCANLRLDRGLVTVFCDGVATPTGLHKFGAILGDGSQTGCNAVLNPGTIFEKNVICYPNVNVGGYVLQDSLIRNESRPKITKRTALTKK